MNNAIVKTSLQDTLTLADYFVKSRFFKDVNEVAHAVVKIQAGQELGIPPFAAMTGINIIQGKVALGANIIATLIANDPRYAYQVVRSDSKVCEIQFYENGKPSGIASFTIQEAQEAQLTGKAVWKQYPSDMLFARAITRGARRYAPGIFGGSPVYTPEELGQETDEDGYIETTARTVIETPVSPQEGQGQTPLEKTGNNTPERPFDFEQLPDMIAKLSKLKAMKKPATDKDVQRAAALLSKAIEMNGWPIEHRHQLQFHLTGFESLSMLPEGSIVHALLYWLDGGEGKQGAAGWANPDSMAVKEVASVLEYYAEVEPVETEETEG